MGGSLNEIAHELLTEMHMARIKEMNEDQEPEDQEPEDQVKVIEEVVRLIP